MSLRKSLVAFVALIFYTICANASFDPNPYFPHLFINGEAGNINSVSGEVLQPFLISGDRLTYLDIAGILEHIQQQTIDQNWLLNLGAGYRLTYGNRIFGLYLFANHARTEYGHNWWSLSPGFEMKSSIWEVNLEADFPITNKKLTTEGWADDLGEHAQFVHQGHSTFSNQVRITENLGTGLSVSIGRRLWQQSVWGYLGGEYYYINGAKDISGINAKLRWQVTPNMQFFVADSYNNKYHNIFNIGIAISLFEQDTEDLQKRLFEPVEPFYSENNNVRTEVQDNGLQAIPEYVNENFFVPATPTTIPGAVVGNGTFENPYVGFTQDNVNDAANNNWADPTHPQRLIFTGSLGTYNVSGSTPIQLNSRQEMHGFYYGLNARSEPDNFALPATGNNRPLIDGAIQLKGNNVLNAIRLQNNGQFQSGGESYGILMGDNVALNTLNNVAIKVNNSDGSATNVAAVDGVLMGHNSELAVIGSNIEATSVGSDSGPTSTSGNAIGIHANGDSTVSFPESLIIVKNSTVTGDSSASGTVANDYSNNGLGILVGNINREVTDPGNDTQITVANNKVVVDNSTIAGVGQNNAYGVLVGNIRVFADSSVGSLIAGNATISVANNIIDVKNNSNINLNSANQMYGVMIGNKYAKADAHAGSSALTNTAGDAIVEVTSNTMNVNNSSVNNLGTGTIYNALIGNVDVIAHAWAESTSADATGGLAKTAITFNTINTDSVTPLFANVLSEDLDAHAIAGGAAHPGTEESDISGNSP